MEDFCVITSYYNPAGYKSKLKNYELFAAGLENSGISLLTVECAFGENDFDLPSMSNIVRFRSHSVLWQRERLINLVVAKLPSHVKYVAWIDCDLLFSNAHWILEARFLLQESYIVQLFERCIRLPHGGREYTGEGKVSVSFGAVTTRRPEVLSETPTEKHGITGGAWAARREIFEVVGLYEHAIIGGADDYIAHAIFGDFTSECVARKMQHNPVLMKHFRSWAEVFYSVVQGKTGFVHGDILHLWHGDLQHRRYFDRHEELGRFGYNPYRDISISPDKPIEWSPYASQGLRKRLKDYFSDRKEDD